jgi:hypothetical protein
MTIISPDASSRLWVQNDRWSNYVNFVSDLSVPCASLSARRLTKSDGKDGRVTRVSAVERKAANHVLCVQTLKLFLCHTSVREFLSCTHCVPRLLRFTGYNSMFS